MTCAQWMDLASLVSFLVWSSAGLSAHGGPLLQALTCNAPLASPCFL